MLGGEEGERGPNAGGVEPEQREREGEAELSEERAKVHNRGPELANSDAVVADACRGSRGRGAWRTWMLTIAHFCRRRLTRRRNPWGFGHTLLAGRSRRRRGELRGSPTMRRTDCTEEYARHAKT